MPIYDFDRPQNIFLELHSIAQLAFLNKKKTSFFWKIYSIIKKIRIPVSGEKIEKLL